MKKFILLLAVAACFSAVQAQKVTTIYSYKSGVYTDLSTNDFDYTVWTSANMRFGYDITNDGSSTLTAGTKLTIKIDPFNDPDYYEYTLGADLAPGATVKGNELTTFALAQYNNSITQLDAKTYQGSVCMTVTEVNGVDLQKGQVVDKCVTFKIKNVAGINDAALENVSIYPTMVNGNLNVNGVENANINIYAINGQLVKQVENANGNISIDMSQCAAGMYLVKIQSENGVRIEKVQVR